MPFAVFAFGPLLHYVKYSVLPLTSGNTEKVHPFEVFLPTGIANLPKPSKVKADQIRTLDRSRIIKMIGALEKEAMSQEQEAMKCHLDLD